MTDGVYIAGACQGPKDIPDTVAQAQAAAARILALIGKGEVLIDPIRAEVVEERLLGLPHLQQPLSVSGDHVQRRETRFAGQRDVVQGLRHLRCRMSGRSDDGLRLHGRADHGGTGGAAGLRHRRRRFETHLKPIEV
jgi:hypothetical protein